MNIIDEIKEKLQRYPHIDYEVTRDWITVLPASENGFEVSLYVGEREDFVVYYNGWHEDFDTREEALECFAFGLSSECRLKETSRSGSAYRWTMEFLRDGTWQDGGTTSLLFFPCWSRKQETYLQNNLVV
jgi:hypothetical protein